MRGKRVMPTNRGVPRCERCGEPVSVRPEMAYQQVLALMLVGAKTVRLPKPTGKWWCRPCVDYLALKRPDTLELFPREGGA